jgi:hypothetical protein
MSNEIAKRYECPKCGGQVICVSPGDGAVQCCGAEMVRMEAKELPSAD